MLSDSDEHVRAQGLSSLSQLAVTHHPSAFSCSVAEIVLNSTSDVSLRVRSAAVAAAAHLAQVVPCPSSMFSLFGTLLKSR